MAEKQIEQEDILKREPELWDRVCKLTEDDKVSLLHYLMGWGIKDAHFLEGVAMCLEKIIRDNRADANLCSR